MNIVGIIIKIQRYANDVILAARTLRSLQEHPLTLETFCKEVGMEVNIGKTKVSFSL
jgi:hypothetical protein